MYSLNPIASLLQFSNQRVSGGNVGAGGFPTQNFSPEMIAQLQQMLLTILAPVIQDMMANSFEGPVSSPPNGPFGPNSNGGLSPGSGYGGFGPSSSAGYPANNPGGYGAIPPGNGLPLPGNGPQSPGNQPGINPSGQEIPTNIDYRDMSKEQRRASSGMSDRERAVLHLWGIQMTSKGEQDGGVLMNVLQNPGQFQPAEVELARELQARDQAKYGGITGKALDEEFFGLYENMTGKDISGKYGQAPVKFAQGPVDMSARLNGQNGLNNFENQVLQLWGHSPLFNQGKIDGNILDYALNSQNTLESNLNRADLQALKDADLASDGVLNGDSLENAFLDTLDRLYLGGPGASSEKTMNDALEEAALRRQGLLPPPEPGSGRTIEDPRRVDPSNQNRNPAGGSCPFLAQAA